MREVAKRRKETIGRAPSLSASRRSRGFEIESYTNRGGPGPRAGWPCQVLYKNGRS